MLTARRKSDGQTVFAAEERPTDGPYACLVCNEIVILKSGNSKTSHFAHAYPLASHFGENESETHRRCKMEIYKALLREPYVSQVEIEGPLGDLRPDILAEIRGARVAIEVQLSTLSIETIIQRTKKYGRKGIYVLWLLQWTPELNEERYNPRPFEKWIHAAYFGQLYYWLSGLDVVAYHFEPALKAVPEYSWRSSLGRTMTAGGYTRRLKRIRRPIRGQKFNLLKDFGPRDRSWFERGWIKIPDSKLFLARENKREAF
jgi:competence protein CoiA